MTGPDGGEVVVRRCTVTVVRRGGWSWGPDPARLPGRVVALLTAALADRYAQDLAGDTDLEITEPVRIDLRIPLAALLAGEAPAGAGFRAYPHGVVETAIAAGRVVSPATTDPARLGERAPAAGERGDDGVRAEEPVAAAAAWRAGMTPAIGLDLLTRALPDLDPATARAILAALTGDTAAPPMTEPDQNSATPAGAPPPDVSAADVPGPVPPPRDSAAVPSRRAGDVEVGSALPFLVAAALDRVGLLPSIGPALAAAGLDRDAPLVAFALATQVLGPLRHGWLREPAALADAAAFAGLAEPPDSGAVTGAAHRLAPVLPSLTGLIGLLLCRGHEPGRPLLLAAVHPRHGGGLLLTDPDGLFPIAWLTEPGPVAPLWRAAGAPAVLVAGAGAGPGAALAPIPVPVLAALADDGLPLICDAPPTRGDGRWHRLGGTRRLWATGGVPGVPPGTDLTGPAGQLDELLTVLAARRPVPRERAGGFGRAVALLAALGLGTIAWQLWRHREAPDPQLALARLGDLGATVRFGSERVEVRLPLGRRFQDLRDRGALRDVPAVAWLDGRTVTFSGG
ncbi:hypothetical protein [Actinoplanes sp. NPDC051851]|uniref:hypothetical protein n=1 Tax=Actinoplanes sp. NPDC051851 TaxID=3154753 RepID=UPI003447B60D